VASIIFKLADTHPDVQPTEGDAGGKNGVAWVLRFGGLMALVSGHHSSLIEANDRLAL
jgi:solute carrier family 45 protein 1/2/4